MGFTYGLGSKAIMFDRLFHVIFLFQHNIYTHGGCYSHLPFADAHQSSILIRFTRAERAFWVLATIILVNVEAVSAMQMPNVPCDIALMVCSGATGPAKYTFKNGASFDGTYVANLKDGPTGKFIYPDKSSYEGASTEICDFLCCVV
eukprot:310478-Prorocentrum_minimum.AAC.8